MAKYNWARDYNWSQVASTYNQIHAAHRMEWYESGKLQSRDVYYRVSLNPDPSANVVRGVFQSNGDTFLYGYRLPSAEFEFILDDRDWSQLEAYGHTPATFPVYREISADRWEGMVFALDTAIMRRIQDPGEQQRILQSVQQWQTSTAEAYPSNVGLPTTPDPKYQQAVLMQQAEDYTSGTATSTGSEFIYANGTSGNYALSATISAPGGWEVGKSWTIRVTGPPNQTVTIAAAQNGIDLGETGYGSTDSNGLFILNGTFTPDTVGTWRETVKVGGQVAGTFSFIVSKPAGPAGSALQPGVVSTGTGTGTGAGFRTDTDTDTGTGIIPGVDNKFLFLGVGAVLLMLFMGRR